jgi:hypothetical protein
MFLTNRKIAFNTRSRGQEGDKTEVREVRTEKARARTAEDQRGEEQGRGRGERKRGEGRRETSGKGAWKENPSLPLPRCEMVM